MNNNKHKFNRLFCFSFNSGKINVSVFAVVALLLFLSADFSVYTLILFCCILIHELSHILVLKFCGGHIKKINVYPFGIDIISDINTLSYTKELWVVVSGGFANLACAFATWCILGTNHSAQVCFFIYASLVYGIGNLIPLPVFDGGRALHIIISKNLLPDVAYALQKWVDRAAFTLFFALSLILLYATDCNMTAVICVAYTALAAVIYEKLTMSHDTCYMP